MNFIKDLTINKLDNMFKNYPLYSQDDIEDKLVILEIFIPGQNIYWLITEGEREENNNFIFFGYCKPQYGEFGYVSFNEIKNLDYNIMYNYYPKPIKLKELINKYSNG